MFPLYDESRIRGKTPWITIFLIVLNSIIFFVTLPNLKEAVFQLGMVPAEILQGQGFLTLISSIFLHAGFWHLFGNMWFLWVFGDNLENHLGRFRFLIFYLICGILASLFYVAFNSQSVIPVVGASGAISGILGGYLILFPKNRIKTLVPIFYFIQIISIPALIFIGIWFLYQFLAFEPGVAYTAHIFGFLSGLILVRFFRK